MQCSTKFRLLNSPTNTIVQHAKWFFALSSIFIPSYNWLQPYTYIAFILYSFQWLPSWPEKTWKLNFRNVNLSVATHISFSLYLKLSVVQLQLATTKLTELVSLKLLFQSLQMSVKNFCSFFIFYFFLIKFDQS